MVKFNKNEIFILPIIWYSSLRVLQTVPISILNERRIGREANKATLEK